MGKFLKIFFGCHARPDRSFYWKGRQFPICARCTGELVGILVGIPTAILMGPMSIQICIVFMLPLVIDGFRQLLTHYTSNNIRRFVTGLFFGIAFVSGLIHFHNVCVLIAGRVVRYVFGDTASVNNAINQFLFYGIG